MALFSWFAIGGSAEGPQGTPPSAPSSPGRAEVVSQRLPLAFEPNRGQSDPAVDFLARGPGYTVFLSGGDAVLSLRAGEARHAVRLGLVGHTGPRGKTAVEPLPGVSNYFRGSDPSGWITAIPQFSSIRYADVYPGIDLRYYGNERQLEYDFELAPGADPQAIRIAVDGAAAVSVTENGSLALRLSDQREVAFEAPLTYQMREGRRAIIPSRYVLTGPREFGFVVGTHDRSLPLVIDPTLVYGTYLGGAGSDYGYAVATDTSGNAYVVGSNTSADFPTTTGPLGPAGAQDAYVAKLNASGTALVYSTEIGGAATDSANSIYVDGSGNAYVTGSTGSSNFPTTAGAYDTTLGSTTDAFVLKLNSTGTALTYSTYLGGSGSDEDGEDIQVNGAGEAYVVGTTNASDFPTTSGVIDRTLGGTFDAFVTKLNATGTGLSWSTYVGGSANETGKSIALDASGNVFVTGHTGSSDLTTTAGAYDTTGATTNDAYVLKLNSTATSRLYSSYLGGSSAAGHDYGEGIDVDSSGNIYVTGYAGSTDFPTTAGAYDTTPNGNDDWFVAKFDPSQSGSASLVYSTMVGGSGFDRGYGIEVDPSGRAIVVGYTGSSAFPTTAAALDSTLGGTYDAAIVKLNAAGSGLVYASFLGGGATEVVYDVVADSIGDTLWLTGYTGSSDFPTTAGAYDRTVSGIDAFVVKYSLNDPPTATADGYPTAEDTPLNVAAPGVLSNDSDPESDPLTAVLVTGPSHAASFALGADGSFSYTPATDYNGSDSFTYRASDGVGTSSPVTVSLTITAVNDSPTISDIQNRLTAVSTPTPAVSFTVGDVETSAGSLTVTGASSNTTLVPNGNIVFGGSGANRTLTITPAAGLSGTATITVTVSDGALTSNDTFVLTVSNSNTTPTISDISNQSILANSATSALAFTVGDAETGALDLVVTGTSSNPTLVPNGNIVFGGSGANRTVTVTPATGETGTATLTVTVSDGVASAFDTFVLTVTNTVPTISDISNQTTDQDTPTGAIPFTVGDAETAAEGLTVTATSGNTTLVPNGNIVLSGSGASRTITLTPAAGQWGTTSITVTVSDGIGSTSDTFELTVGPASLAPYFMTSGTYTGNGAASRAITGLGFQPDVVFVKSVEAYIGVARTSTMVGDASKDTTAATALEADQIESLNADGFTVGGDDQVNRNGRVYHWVAFKAANGYLKVGSYTGDGNSGRTVTGVGFAPEAVFVLSESNYEAVFRASPSAEAYNLDNNAGNSTTWITGLDSDGFTVGSDNRVNRSGTVYHYLAYEELSGVLDVGSYAGNASDGRSITGVGFQPEWVVVKSFDGDNAVHHTDSQGPAVDLSLFFDGTADTANRIQALESDGFQIGTDNDVNASGRDYLYMAWRAQSTPTITDITNQTTNEDTPTSPIAFTVGDGETPPGSLTVTASSSNQALVPDGNIAFGGSGASRTVTLTPAANMYGTVTITVTVSDGVSQAYDTFVLTVNPVNDAPTITDITNQTTNEDTATGAIAFTIGDVDNASSSLTVTGSSGNPALVPNGNIVLGGDGASRTVTITPAADQTGTATITVTVSDGSLSSPDTFVLTVSPVADTPSVTSTTTAEDTQSTSGLVISRNAADGAEVTHFKITGITNGTLYKNDGVTQVTSGMFITFTEGNAGLKFTPSTNSMASGSFTVQASTSAGDSGLGGGTAAATITVTPVADTPSVTNATTDEDTQTTSGLVISRNAADGTEVTHFKITAVSNGTLYYNDGVTPLTSGTFITFAQGNAGLKFTPSSNSVATGSFLVQASTAANDGGLGGSTAAATITVNPVNDVPTISDISNQTVNEDTPTGALAFIVSDVETAAGSLTVTGSSSNQTLVPNANIVFGGSGANRTVTVTPAANESGTATITVTVSDGADEASDTFVLTVTAVNDPPTISDIGNQSTNEDTPTGPIAFTVDDIDTPVASLTVTAASNNQTVVPNANIVVGGSGANRTIAVTPGAGQSGTATITVTVSDGAGSAPDTFVLTVVAVVDGINVTPTEGLAATETGGTATFTVVLLSVPTADVTFGLSSSDTTEGTVSPSTLTFTNTNWSLPQTVTVTGVDDLVDDADVAYNIVTAAATSADADYSGVNASDVSVTTIDDDTAGFTVSPSTGLTTSEAGQTATFSVVLTSQPTADVTVGMSSSDATEGTVSPASLTFTSANWGTAQTVTVAGADDFLDDGDVGYSVITAAATSSDTVYNGLNASDAAATNTDDDTAGVTVTPTSGLTTTEAGGTTTFTVVLTSQPTADVTIGVTSSDTTEGTVSPASLVFTSATWNAAQTVTVTGVDDFLDDGNVSYSLVTAAATSSDTSYSGLNASDVSATSTDDDAAGVTVTPTSGLTTTEAGGTTTFTVVLTSQPTADVTIGVSSNDTTEGTVSPASLVFTSLNWSTAQTVTVTGVGDSVDDGDILYTVVTAAATSGDASYSGSNPGDVTVTNTDDDTAGITVTPTSGLTTTEAGGTATFTIVLTSQPSANVVVGLSSSDTTEGTVSPASLTFTAATWSTPQTVTVTGANDVIIDGAVAYTIVTGAATSADPGYGGINPADVSVSNADNDVAGITVTPTSGLTTTEAGGTATFAVGLTSQPTADVTVGLTSSNTAEATVSPASVTFTSATWSTAQTVTLSGVDDHVDDGNVAYTVITTAATSADSNYNGVNPSDVSGLNVDNDTAGITVSPVTGLTTTESGGTATFSVVLTSQPTAAVVIALSSNDTTEGTVSPASVTFTTATWNAAQTVTITGVDDLIADGSVAYTIVTAAAASGDGTYNGFNPSDVSVVTTDDETPGITVAPTSGLMTDEGGATATFVIFLDSQPVADVSIAISSGDATEGAVSPTSVTFTAATWSTPHTVTVTGVDDDGDDGNIVFTIVTAPAVSADGNYSGLDASNVSVVNTDDDTAGITVTPTAGLTTDETGDTATFTVVLATEPTADVTIGLSSSDATEGTVSPASLTFTSGNWNTPQTVTVTGVDDVSVDGATGYTVALAAATSADVSYNSFDASDVSVSNADDDTATVTVSPTSGLTTDEGGGTATFTVVLDSQPSADVTVGLSSSDTGEGTVGPAALTFTPATWSTAQTVTVTGVDDVVDDGDQPFTVMAGLATSADANFNGVDPGDVSASNADDDVTGITVTPTSGLATDESGGTATFTVVLTSQPLANVTINLSSSDTTEANVAPALLTFAGSTWSTPQTVTVTGVDDVTIDGAMPYTVILEAAVSTDPTYGGVDPADVSGTNSDDDTATFTVSPTSGLTTTEGGGTATFTVVLDSQPSADVTIGLSSSDTSEGTVGPASLTFSSAAWNTPQTVTLTGVDDVSVDGSVAYTIVTGPSVSTDATFNGVNPADVSASNSDNDTATFTVSPTSGLTTTEGSGTATFTVVLDSQPSADVTIGLSTSDASEGTVAPTSLTFTPAAWNAPQTVTLTGTADAVDDGDQPYTVVTAAATSADAAFNGVDPADVSASNTDDDVTGITVTPTSGVTTDESGGTSTFTVVLTSQPTADVTTAVSSSDPSEGTVSPTSVTFTALDWSTPQTVTLTGVDDVSVDGTIGYTVVLGAASSTDPTYGGVDPSDVSASNADNDTATFTVSPTSGLTTDEGGGTATFTVVGDSQPSADVTIALSSSDPSEGTVSPTSLTFTSATWNTPQTVTVTGADDPVVDGSSAFTVVTGAAVSADATFDGVDPADVSASNSDNDAATFTVSPTNGLTTTEGGGTATFTVVLDSQPSADVTIGLSSSDPTEGTVAPVSLTFTSANWNSPQTVTLTGVADAVDDGDQAFTIITGAAASADLNFNGIDPADVSASNTDDDATGISVTPTSGLGTDESGGTATFTVVLTSQPTADVTIGISSSDTTEGIVAPGSLTFTASNWNTPQTATVTGVDDVGVDGAIGYTVVLGAATSADATYGGVDPADVSASNADNDTATFTVSPVSGLTTTEGGGTVTFTVVLDSQPSADVTIGLSSSDTSEGTVGPASLTFTSANWSATQTVTLTGVADAVDDGDQAYTVVTGAATSADGNFNGVDPADVSASNTDDDVTGITATPTAGLGTDESGGTATFTVVLASQPTADVTVGVSSSDTTEGTVAPASLTFTAADWSIPQTVTVTGVDDVSVDGATAYTVVLGAATSADPTYGGLDPADVAVSNSDNDSATFTVTPAIGLTTTEGGGTATFTVVLDGQPSADVTIALSSSDSGEATVGPSSLTFTSATWSTPQTVTVTGVDDVVVDGAAPFTVVLGAATSADTTFNGVDPTDVVATNSDNDTATLTVTPTSGLTTTEGGGTAVFTVVLDSQPSASVVLTVSSGDTSEGTAAPGSLTFTSATWNAPQTVTLTGVGDAVDDGDQAYTVVTGTVTSADANFNGVNPADVSATNTDDDVTGITVTPTSGLVTDEGGGTATFTVVLTSQPTADVTIGVASSDTGEGTVAPASLIFTPATWDVPHTVTLTGVDDVVVDGPVAFTALLGAATSADPTYGGLDPADVSASNTDNDTATFTVTPTSGLTTTEGGGTATFTIVLDSQPSADVTVALSSSDATEGTVGPGSLTFTSVTWNAPQTVTVTGVNDIFVDGPTVYSVVIGAAVSADVGFNGVDTADVSATNADNDTATFTVTPTSGLTTTEGGGTATFTVVLDSQPTADVTIGLSSSDATEGTVDPASLTFTAANWSTPQTVTLTGVDDVIIDGPGAYSAITGAAVSADVNFSGVNPADVSASTTDNDAPGVTITPTSGLTTSEGGGTSTFTVILNSQPAADVTFGLTSSDTTEGTVSPSSLTFAPAGWNMPQTVTVTGANDVAVDGSIAYTIVTAPTVSGDGNYNGVNPPDVSATNLDDDLAGFTVSPTSGLTTTETGGTATFSVVLTSQPTGDVTLGLSSTDTTEGAVSPATLTFTPAAWNTPKTVTATGVNDVIIDGGVTYTIVTGTATSTDANYNGVNPADVSVTNSDNDTAGITITPTGGLSTTESGGTATFTVVLTSQPTNDVTIGLTSSSASEGSVGTPSVTFTPATWNVAQTVTVTGVDDFVVDGSVAYSIVTAAATSADGHFSGVDPSDVSVTNADNDTAGITVSPTSFLVTTEGGETATFTIVLTSQPTADVTVGLSSSNTSEGTVSPTSVTFTSANWNTPQTVTVTGVDDLAADGEVAYSLVTASATSADANYSGLDAEDVGASNADNDTPGITVVPIGGLTTSEGGGTATFRIALATQPTDDVIIGLSSNDTSEGTVNPTSVTFTSVTWNIPQTVTVTGVDDFVDDGNITYSIVTSPATSLDPNYDGVNAANVGLTNTDNDSVGVAVTPTNGLTTMESGGTATFTVVLTSEPTSNVSLGLTSSDSTEGTVSPPSLTFTNANWNTAQTVTVTGVDDLTADGNVAYTVVTGAAASADAGYNGLAVPDVSVTNTNDDTAGIQVTPTSGLTTTENGGTATFSVALTSQPTADVAIDLSSSDSSEGAVSPGSLTFTSATWNTPQTVTITGLDDAVADGGVGYTVVIAAATSADAGYAGVDASDVSVTTTDDDSAGISVTPTSGLATSEQGLTAVFTVALGSEPTADVTIGMSSSDATEGSVSPASLVFTAVNWNAAQTVTVTGVDDVIIDGSVPFSVVTNAAVSADGVYNSLDPDDVSAANADNDTAGFTIVPSSGLATTEGGGTATFTVVLTSQPTADVTIGVSSSDLTEGTASPASLVFTPTDWNSPHTVTVAGADDVFIDGNVGYSIVTGAATSADVNFQGLDPADVAVTNTDDEVAGISVSPTSGLTTTELGGTATFVVVLTSQPAADVMLTLTSSDTTEGTVSPTSLTFTSATWNVPQTVTATGVDDAMADGSIAFSVVTGAATSGDTDYDGVDGPDVSVSNTDNDVAGVTITPSSGLTTTETSGTATFIVVLTSQPTADVVIGLSSSDTTEGTVLPTTLTFTDSTWNVVQVVTVTGVDDSLADGDVAYSVVTGAASSSDAGYNGLNPADAALVNSNDDTSGISVAPSGGLTTGEDGTTATFTVVLTSQPTADVTVGVNSSDTTEGTVAPASLTFLPSDWSTPQTVTLTGVDDPAVDGAVGYTVVTAAAVSTDPGYTGVDAANVSVTNADDDVAGFAISPTSGHTTSETGGSSTFTVRLTSQPTTDVTVGLSSSDATEGTISPSALTFTGATWSTPQTVTITGADDFVADGSVDFTIITDAAASGDAFYNGIDPADVAATNADDDVVGVTITPSTGLTTTESGGTTTFAIVLSSQPADDVTIPLGSSDPTEGSVSPASVTFTAATWNAPVIVTVTGVDDFAADGAVAYSVLTGTATSSDPVYNGVDPADAPATNTDDDTAGIAVSPVIGLTTDEAGGTATFSVALTSQPISDVTIVLSTSDASEGSVAPPSLVFTALTWNIAQTVTITGVDDAIADGPMAFTVATAAATSGDPGYNGMDAVDVAASNVDDDAVGVVVSPTSALSTTEAGGTATFSLVLASQPTADVSIGLSSSDTTEGIVGPASVTFTAANWNVAQTVTVTGQEDSIIDGSVDYTVFTAAAVSADAGYNGLNPDDVSGSNADNDTAGVIVAPTTGLSTTETGGTGTFTVVLTSQPSADVTIDLSSSDTTEGTVSPASVTFTAANWNVPQTVTVTGVDDGDSASDTPFEVVTAPAVSADTNFDGVNPSDVTLTNALDVNDPPVITVPSSQATNEDTPLLLTSSVGNAIDVSDPDSGTGSILVTLTAIHGTVTLSRIDGLTFLVGSGIDDASVSFLGTAGESDAALDGLSFKPSADFNGSAQIQVVVSDEGQFGTGGSKSANATLDIAVAPVGDAPTISDITDQTTPEDTALGPLAITVNDVDTDPTTLVVSATSSDQALVPDASLVVGGTGTTRTLTLTPASNQTGTATVTVTVSDGALTASDTFLVTITPVNDAPTISDIDDQTTPEDTPVGPLSFSVSDPEADPSTLTVTATSSNQTLIPDASLVMGGSGANRTVTVTPAANQIGTTTITISVSDGTATTTETFVVTVVLSDVTISGTITRLGAPVAGVTIDLSGGAGATTVTDANGQYHFDRVPLGVGYAVTPSADGYAFSPVTHTIASLAADEVVDFEATQLLAISGRVSDLSDGGVSNVTMTLSGSLSDTMTTADDGLYSFTVPEGGTYTVTPTRTGFIFAPSSATETTLQTSAIHDFQVTSGVFKRYFSEGATGPFFDTEFAILNPTDVDASVTLRFERSDGTVVPITLDVPANTRKTVNPEDLPGMESTEFSTVLDSDVPVVFDRTMRWDSRGYGSHAETAIDTPQTEWYLAEGATIGAFNLFYLVHNPNAQEAQVQIKYLLPAPHAPIVKLYTVPANTRKTVWVNVEDPQLAAAELSAMITADIPVIVERAMYLDGGGRVFNAGHEGAGVPAPATQWFLAEGATGSFFDCFVLVANPTDTDAEVRADFLLPDGTTITKTYTVMANSRFNIWVDLEDPRLANTPVSTKVTSINDVPIVVERAMWWPGDASGWQEGHNSAGAVRSGTKWALAAGESGGSFNSESFVLIANTSSEDADVKVKVLFEDGTSLANTYTVVANSRFTVQVGTFFPAAMGRRYGVVVESLGETPGQIVVERAMYSDAVNGPGQTVPWAAGTDAVGTRIR